MELWDLYDKNRIPLGKTHKRGEKITDGYHLTVHILLFDASGERLLIQQRAACKDTFAGKWDITAAGSVQSGESSSLGAHRELLEELGIDQDFEHIRPHLTMNYRDGFGDYYLIHRDVDLTALTLQTEEVQAVRYASCDEIIELIRSGEFINYHESLIRFLFDVKNAYSSFSTSSTARN